MENPRKQLFWDLHYMTSSFHVVDHKENFPREMVWIELMKWNVYACRFTYGMITFHRSLSSSNIEVLEEDVFATIPKLGIL